MDATGNVYIADSGDDAIKEWNAATQTVTTLVSSGLKQPVGRGGGQLGQRLHSPMPATTSIKEWNAKRSTVSTLVSTGLYDPAGVAVDASGNVYIADPGGYAIEEWSRRDRRRSATLVSTWGNGTVLAWRWTVRATCTSSIPATYAREGVECRDARRSSTLVSSGLNYAGWRRGGRTGNVYIADTGHNAIKELPRAFMPGGAVSEGAAAGSGTQSLPVLPTSESLTGLFAPGSDQAWLTIGSVSGVRVPFSFSAE